MIRLRVLLLLLVPASLAAQDTVQFNPTVQQPTFAVREPVLRVRPGTVLVSKTHFGPYYGEAGGAFPGEVGPIYIEGATTRDMLKIQIVKVRPNHALAASQVYSDFGGLATDSRVRLLNEPIAARRYVWRIDTARMVGTTEMPKSRVKRMEIDLQPMLGRIAVAPRGHEAFAGLWPGDFGGNMDAQEVREGTAVYLPVFHDGDYGFERLDAYTLVGQVGESTVANIVDPAYSVVAKIRKRYLR